MQIKNWQNFQHFKDRKPPWIKLYRDLLNDLEFHNLPGDAAKLLICLWLIAAEDQGEIPDDAEKLAFRLRTSKAHIIKNLPLLSHWLVQLDIEKISKGYQSDTPEKRRERDRERDRILSPGGDRGLVKREDRFEEFWKIHSYGSKKEARQEYHKLDAKGAPPDDELLAILSRQVKERIEADRTGQFVGLIPHLCRWFKHERWEDAPVAKKEDPTMPSVDEAEQKKFLEEVMK